MGARWVGLASALALVLGCGAPAGDEALRGPGQPIVAGALDTGDPAIVELLAIRSGSLSKCTATLVTPRLLLTAGHCIAETAGATYGVFPGNDDHGITRQDLLAVSATVYDPQFGDPTKGHDLAVVVLATPLPTPVVPINRAALVNATGKVARYVGYGLTDGVKGTGSGIKRQASAPIELVNRVLIGMGANDHLTCNGDSGGPLLMDDGTGKETIIGVTSFGDQDCLKSGFFMRLDTQLGWVDQQIQKYDPEHAPPPAADGGVPGADAHVDGAVARDAGSGTADTAPVRPEVDPSKFPRRDAAAAQEVRPDGSAPRPAPARRDAASADPEETSMPTTVTGGCACALGAQPTSGPGAMGAVALGLVGLCLSRRRGKRR